MSEDFDVIVVGAGLSGISAGYHLQRDCPTRSYAILEARDAMGGTWDLFRYPGIRSDSDMHTLGFDFEPWTEQKAIADGPSIWNYIHRIAKERDIGLTVIGPDDALAGGIVDRFNAHGLKAFGPTEAAAQLESSKAFAKELMERIGVPTARHRSFTDADAAYAYIRAEGAPIVIKASGLAAGKGAFVCHDETEALSTAREMLEEGTFGGAGSEIVIEDYMVGDLLAWRRDASPPRQFRPKIHSLSALW